MLSKDEYTILQMRDLGESAMSSGSIEYLEVADAQNSGVKLEHSCVA